MPKQLKNRNSIPDPAQELGLAETLHQAVAQNENMTWTEWGALSSSCFPKEAWSEEVSLKIFDNMPLLVQALVNYGCAHYLNSSPECFKRLTMHLALYQDFPGFAKNMIFKTTLKNFPEAVGPYLDFYTDVIDFEEAFTLLQVVQLPETCRQIETYFEHFVEWAKNDKDYRFKLDVPKETEILPGNLPLFNKIKKFIWLHRYRFYIISEWQGRVPMEWGEL